MTLSGSTSMNRRQNFGPPYISGTSSSFLLIFSNSQSKPSFSPSCSQALDHSSIKACLYLSAFASLIASCSSVPRTCNRVRPARPSGRQGRARSAGAPCAPLRAGAPARRRRQGAREGREGRAQREDRRHYAFVQDCGKVRARRTAGASRGFQRLSRSPPGTVSLFRSYPRRLSAATYGRVSRIAWH